MALIDKKLRGLTHLFNIIDNVICIVLVLKKILVSFRFQVIPAGSLSNEIIRKTTRYTVFFSHFHQIYPVFASDNSERKALVKFYVFFF